MPLGVPWWLAKGESVRWTHDWVGWLGTVTVFGSYVRAQLSICQLYQRPYAVSNSESNVSAKFGADTGYFYLKRSGVTTGLDASALAVDLLGARSNAGVTYQPQWLELDPPTIIGWLQPEDATSYYNATYKTGFIQDRGGPHVSLSGTNADIIIWFKDYPGALCRMWHYNPWAWSGTVPEVVAAIVMKSGLDSSFIDIAAFDNAYDAYDLTTGDLPWRNGSSKWNIHPHREVGSSVYDLIEECISCTRDLYYINEAGQLSVSSYTRPHNVLASLGYGDGILGEVSWIWSSEYLYNVLHTSWGDASRAWGPSGVSPHDGFNAVEESALESAPKNIYTSTDDRVTSIAKYGAINFDDSRPGDLRIVERSGLKPSRRSHFRHQLGKHGLVSGAEHLFVYMNSDGKPRRFFEFKQDLIGLNFGVGDEVQNVSLSSDGDTIDVTRCISKKYSFKELTVASILMEIPDNLTSP